MNHTVSIIIPCYNYAIYLSTAINSALSQSYDNIEVIVINDGSTDNTEEIAKSFGDKIKYISQHNQGVSIARNNAISSATGKYIICLDADDVLKHNAVENLIRCSKNHIYELISGKVEITGLSYSIVSPRSSTLSEIIHQNTFVQSSMFTKKAWQDAGGYDSNIPGSEDWEFWIRLVKLNSTISICDEIIYTYSYRTDGKYYTTSLPKKKEVIDYILKKHTEFKTFVINLQQYPNKKQFILDQLQKHNINNYEFINAIDGNTLSDDYISTIYDDDACNNQIKRSMAKTEIGCVLSHLSIYKNIIENDIEYALILEDDAVLSNTTKNFPDLLTNDMDILLLGHQVGGVELLYPQFNISSYSVTNIDHVTYGAYGYVITKSGASKMLQLFSKIQYPIDCWTWFSNVLNIYYITPIMIGFVRNIGSHIDEDRKKLQGR